MEKIYVVQAFDMLQGYGYTVGAFSNKEKASDAVETDKKAVSTVGTLELDYRISELNIDEIV